MFDLSNSLFTGKLVIISVAFPSVATFIVGLRVYARRVAIQPFLWDDWTVFISLVNCRRTFLCISRTLLNILGY